MGLQGQWFQVLDVSEKISAIIILYIINIPLPGILSGSAVAAVALSPGGSKREGMLSISPVDASGTGSSDPVWKRKISVSNGCMLTVCTILYAI